MTTTKNWNLPREKSVILFYPGANFNSRWQSCISKPDQKRHLWLLSLFLDRWDFTSFVTLTKFVNVNAMVDTRSTKKTKYLKDEENSPNHTFMWKRVRVPASSIIILMESLRRPFLCSCNQICAMTNTGAWDVGDTGSMFLRQPFYADNTLHTLSPTSSSERTCGGWAVYSVQWTHLWRCSLFKLNSRNLARARCRGRFLPPSITGIVSSTQVKEGHKPPAQVPQVW